MAANVAPMRIGVLTGGGDCPGLNAVIRALVRRGIPEYGYEFLGFRDGWRGPLEGDTVPLDIQAVRGILPRGGTILGSSRTNPLADSAASGGRSGLERVRANLSGLGVEALVAIGGEDTLGVAARLNAEGVPVVGVPKTIDNDLGATDYTFGFDTAVNIAMEAIDRLHTTAESHHRALIIEVMGRHAGWIALHSGMAGGANVILIPEKPFSMEKVCAYVEHRFLDRYAPLVVVAEGARPEEEDNLALSDQRLDSFGHVRLGGIGQILANEIEKRTGKEARATVLGHIQRGGTPTAFDRVLATRFGVHAIDAVHDGAFGMMVALHGTQIVHVPIAEATSQLKLVPPERYAEAEVFFG
jgi:ATP-dependent phosphofructokinase / diphosphate-dependent phosphofructokinase